MRRRPTAKLRGLVATLAGVALAVSVSLAATQLVLAAPGDPDFNFAPETPVPGQTVKFTATNTKQNDSVEWDFENDGGVDATGTTVEGAYATPGQRTVLMRVRRSGGEVVGVLKPVRVNAPPRASFTSSPNPATVGETVQFNAAASSDPDGTITRYEWDLDNDGQFDDATGITASRTFTSAGSCVVSERGTDNHPHGSTSTTATVVSVNSTRQVRKRDESHQGQVKGRTRAHRWSSSRIGAVARRRSARGRPVAPAAA